MGGDVGCRRGSSRHAASPTPRPAGIHSGTRFERHEIDRRTVDRDYQIACIKALSAEVSHGRRKLLAEMATGTGETRTAAAFVKRLFEAGIVTRVLFLVDRIALAGQAEDAFNDHLRVYPCHVLRPGRNFDTSKRVTIATLQTMISGVPKSVVGILRFW